MVFSDKLINWYKTNKRELPWRNTIDPYKIWVSEVILQQTRIEQGFSYYERFIIMYPDIYALAKSDEDKLLKLWQGLGYYTRARNMLTAAKEIAGKYNGIFPRNFNEIIKIKGIGKYTASAILSFAYNIPHPVIDGNVKRIIARYFNIREEIKSKAAEMIIEQKLQKIFDIKRPAEFNQAIMDFGALQCKVSNPLCSVCIFKDNCLALKHNKVSEIPAISKKKTATVRYFYYIVPIWEINGIAFTYLMKRESGDIWKHLFQFPLIEMNQDFLPDRILQFPEFKSLTEGKKYSVLMVSEKYSHKLTHQIINAVFIRVKILEELENKHLKKIAIKEIHNYPVSRLIEKYLLENVFSNF